ncbi:MAG: hypothetical protein JWL76_860 [Thermoleophilia bacterium]|nr:hypothetical protein [Thermoleophilia bacterium]
MTETMLVRAAGGGWEELRPQTEMPDGGLVEVFGEDIGPVLGTAAPVIVAACQPVLSTGQPDAICLDPDGGVWIVQLALDGDGALTLPQLLAFGGGLAGMSYDAFEGHCDRASGDPLSSYIEARAGSGFHKQSFEVAVADALAHGRFRLVAIVRDAAPTLVQSMRFLNSTGAMGSLYEATSFASATVTAVRAKAVDVGSGIKAHAAPSGSSDTAEPRRASPSATDLGAAGFVAATGKASGDDTSALMAQLQKACLAAFDEVTYEGESGDARMSALLDAGDGPVAMVAAGTDGSVVVSFESLGDLDPGWSVRTELCQGMERLLGADLGDVRKISQLNLSIGEHLMDATLMEALAELLTDTVAALREMSSARGAREAAAA